MLIPQDALEHAILFHFAPARARHVRCLFRQWHGGDQFRIQQIKTVFPGTVEIDVFVFGLGDGDDDLVVCIDVFHTHSVLFQHHVARDQHRIEVLVFMLRGLQRDFGVLAMLVAGMRVGRRRQHALDPHVAGAAQHLFFVAAFARHAFRRQHAAVIGDAQVQVGGSGRGCRSGLRAGGKAGGQEDGDQGRFHGVAFTCRGAEGKTAIRPGGVTVLMQIRSRMPPSASQIPWCCPACP